MADYKVKKESILNKDQMELMRLITEGLTKGSGPLSEIFGGFNQESFQKNVATPTWESFKNTILPGITEKYIASNRFGGTDVINAEARAAQALQGELAKMMYEGQQQQKQNQLSGINTLLSTKSYENVYQPKEKKSSIWEKILPAVGMAVGGIGGSFIPGIGTMAGASAGGAIGSAAQKAIAG